MAKAMPRPRLGSEDRVYKPCPLDRVVVLGMGPSVDEWRRACYYQPFDRNNGKNQIWVINAGAFVFDHDVVFDMHDWENYKPQKSGLIGDYKDRLANHHKPVVSVRSIGKSMYEYPLAEVISTFGSVYFRCGLAYMVAFAMLCGAKKITFYGCDFANDDPSQMKASEDGRANLEYWIARAETWKPGRGLDGVEIGVAANSELLSHATRLSLGPRSLYGYEHLEPVIQCKDSKMKLMGFGAAVHTDPMRNVHTAGNKVDDISNILLPHS